MKQIIIPINGENTLIQSEHSYVIIGANGSGKSHLGAWIENNDPSNTTLRISAQRAISLKENIIVRSEQSSISKLIYGDEFLKKGPKQFKWGGDEYTTKLIDDYEYVLSAIFAHQSKEDRLYVKDCQQKEERKEQKADVPVMIVDKIVDIWDSVFPQRKILFEDANVKAKDKKGSFYHARKMSDGERVAIYLIGQCLVVPKGITIIIDEPEIHLHKAIMQKLWDKIEEYCPNNTFVYITHDLDFASSRKDAKTIWVKSYDRENGTEKWDIQVLEDHDVIPESLMIEVLGNRKDVLFVEGEKGSYDSILYSYIYDKHYIVPCHNCYNVIELTKAFNEDKIKGLHNISVQGIIDRDYLSRAEIESYREKGIHPLEVAEVENLYLLPEIQQIVAEHMALEDIPKTLSEVKDFLFKCFEDEKETQLTSMCEREIQFKLSRFQRDKDGLNALKSQYDSYVNSIDIEKMYHSVESSVNVIIAEKNLEKLLAIYNRKSLHQRVSKYFKLSNNEYPQLVLRLLKTEKKEVIVNSLRKHMPQL